MQHLLCAAFAIVVLLLGCSPTGLNADQCYHHNKADKDAYFTLDFTGSFGVSKKPCNGAKAMGCYEFYTKGPGQIRYRAGCGASECPASAGFDASLHTCVKCKEQTTDAVAAASDGICSSASIMPSLAPGKNTKTVCPFVIQISVVKKSGETATFTEDGNVFCNTDTKCGTKRWLVSNTGTPVSNYTGCISDCNKEFQEAGGSATDKCVECDNRSDCKLKQPKDAVVLAAPASADKKPGPTTTKGAAAGFSASAAVLGLVLAVTSCLSRLQ